MRPRKITVTTKKEVDRLDVVGKWPKATWMQKRLAMLKLVEIQEAQEEFNNGCE